MISESVNDGILNTIKDWQATRFCSPKRWGRGQAPPSAAVGGGSFRGYITWSQFVAGVMRDEFNWSDVALIPPALSEDMFYPSDRLGQSVIACSGVNGCKSSPT